MSFMNPKQARTLSDLDRFNSGVLYDPLRIDILRQKIASNTLRSKVKAKWNTILSLPATPVIQGVINPWNIPENYGDDSESNHEILGKIQADFQAAAGYAFRYLVNNDPADAGRAAQYLLAYSTITEFKTNAGSTLNWFDKWPILIQTAMMISGSAAYTATIDANFKSVTNLALNTLEPIAFTRNNNWAAWGLTLELSYALFVKNRKRWDAAVNRWKVLFDDTVVSNFRVQNGGPAQGQLKNNVAHREIYRMGASQGNGSYGLLYSAFHLDGMAIAAEWARLGGTWLYDHVTPDGSSLKGFWEVIAHEKRWGDPKYSGVPAVFDVQWYNTSNLESNPNYKYYYTGYYTNRVGGSFYSLQELWPLQDAVELMHGPFQTVGYAAGTWPPNPAGSAPTTSYGVPIAQDYYGMYGMDLLYSDRPLWD